jgi:hypothetical protein
MASFPFLILAATAATAPLPSPLTGDHIRDLGCVAVVAIVAEEQRQGLASAVAYPDMRTQGRKWAGIVGDRVTFESGQPKEAVAFALREAAANEQARMHSMAKPNAVLYGRFAECAPRMKTDMDADADAVKAALPLPLPITAKKR